jgi:hypothetical protein
MEIKVLCTGNTIEVFSTKTVAVVNTELRDFCENYITPYYMAGEGKTGILSTGINR